MLVQFHKGFILEGESTVKTYKHFWSRGKEVRRNIYVRTGVSGFCDESEVEKELERLVKEEALTCNGYGKDFSGWKRLVPYADQVELAKELDWDTEDLIPDRYTITRLDDWTVEEAAKKLNGEQFAQYCRDYGIAVHSCGCLK